MITDYENPFKSRDANRQNQASKSLLHSMRAINLEEDEEEEQDGIRKGHNGRGYREEEGMTSG